MTIQFINPLGKLNTADLTEQQIEKLKKLEGYHVLLKPKVRISISDNLCTACES